MSTTHGSCLCRSVTYEITGTPGVALYCHCGRCRRWTGSAVAALLVVRSEQLRVTAGQDQLQTYREAGFVDRTFCRTCGANLFGCERPGSPTTVVTMGTLEDDPQVRPAVHCNVAFKAPWHEITDDLPRFAELPPPPPNA